MIEEYEGFIAEIIFHNDENGYTVAVFETEIEAFTCVGNLPSVGVGRRYKLTGKFVDNPRYGEQFSINTFEEMMPSTKEGLIAFLASDAIKGIGPKTAAAVVSRFGEDTLNIMDSQPERLAEVPGIGPKTAAKIAESYAIHREFAKISIALQGYGISAAQALKLYQIYGTDTVHVIEENPYKIIDNVKGIGFKKADQIADMIGIAPDDEYRIQSGIKFTLSWYAGEGNTYLPEEELCEKTGGLLDQPRELILENLEQMAFEGKIHIDIIEGQRVAYLTAFFVAEQNVCKCLRQISNATLRPINGEVSSLISRTEAATGIKLSEQQKQAVITSLDAGVTVITGGPGTGKTTIINTIINVLEASELKTAIAAPTGRAAKRITETSGHAASTIHRLLEYTFYESKDGDDEFLRFGRNSENPLEYDAVIVDEASMIDLMLMNGLVSAIRPSTRFIIVGDDDQLPSVGAGNVLRDIIASEYIHCNRLTEIFRQAQESMIVVNAHKINRGEYPDCNAKDKDFFFMRRNSEREMLDTIIELCTTRLPNYYRDLVPGGLESIRDIQVLTPVRKGVLGTLSMNSYLQGALNPPSEFKEEKTFGDKLFREGDKVMQIRNNYEMQWKNQEDFSDGTGIFNGDVGFIDNIDTEYNNITVVFDGTKYVTYNFNQLDELELAYAVTVHKSQGSEFPIVIMPMSWFPPVLATRNLLYTGVTRGKQIVVLVGSENKLHGMVDNNRISERFSGLDWRLRKFFEIDNI